MNKAAVVYSGGRNWGGIETYLANLFRLYDREKIELLLVSLGEWELTRVVKALDRGGPGPAVLSGRRVRLRTLLDLRRLLKSEAVALVVSQGTVANAYARLAALLAGVPSLVVVHSQMKLDYARPVIRLVYGWSDRLLRPVTKSYITVSRSLADGLIASGVDSNRVQVIYNGVEVAGSDLEADRQAGRKCQPVRGAGDEVRLASVGRLHPVKNFDSLIRALALLPEGVRLTIWGDGDERPRLEALVRELGLSGRVALPGESKGMAEALEQVHIYVQPSKSEGCSFAVAEAQLHGRPVVVTPRGGLPEQVDHGVTGVIAEDISPQELAEAIAPPGRGSGTCSQAG